MEKLKMCRICMAENSRLYLVNKTAQTTYEKLTGTPFVTKDKRPMRVCADCYKELQQCCQFRRDCLEVDELFAQSAHDD